MKNRFLCLLTAGAMALTLAVVPAAAQEGELPRLPNEPADVAFEKEVPPAPEEFSAFFAEPATEVCPTPGQAPVLLLNEPEEDSAALFSSRVADQAVSVTVSAEGQVVGTLCFTLNSQDGTALLSSAEPGVDGMLVVPHSISCQGRAYTVTAIGDGALAGQPDLTQLWLPHTVSSIGHEAFMDCQQLLAVGTYDGQGSADPYALPHDVDYIGDRTFRGCVRLQGITIPAAVTRIGAWAFAYCYSLEQVIFAPGSRLTDIHQGCFYYCSALKELALPQNLNYVSLQAFSYCGGLKSVTIPGALRELPEKAFYACSALETVDFTGDGLTTMGNSAFFWCTKLETIRTAGAPGLPATLTSIPKWAFYRCDSLAQLDLSRATALREIKAYAFNESGVVDLKLPQGLKYIRLLAFEGCGKLRTIDWNRPESDEDLLVVEEKAFAKTGLEEVTVPQLYAGSGLEMFYDCDSLTTVTMDPKALFVPDGAFRDCDNLTTVTLGTNLEKVGLQSFYTCPKLTDVDLADATSLKVIGPLAFCRTALPSVTLTGPIEEIGLSAFGINRALQSFEIGYTGNPGGYFHDGPTGVLYQVNGTSIKLIQYPAGRTDTTFAVPEPVTAIESYAFAHSEHLEEVTFPSTLRVIGYYALSHCINLKVADIPTDVIQGEEVFEGSYHIARVTLPPDLVELNSSSLPVNSKITTVTLPASVAKIDTVPSPFASLARLEEILVDENNPYFTSVDGVLFSKDGTVLYAYPRGKAGSEYVVPDGVTTIWYGAFSDVTSLTHLTFPASVTTVRPSACDSMPNLERLDILREMPGVDKNPNGTKAYNGFLTNTGDRLQVYVHGDPTDQTASADWVQKFCRVCTGSSASRENVHVDFYKPATQAGDRFLADGVIYTLADPEAKTVTVGGNAHYEGDSVFIPDQVLHQGTAYAVTAVEEGAFPSSVRVTRREDLTALTPGKTDLVYGDVLVLNAPASVEDGTTLTLAAGEKTLTAQVTGGAARVPVDKTLVDALGFGTHSVHAAAGDAQAEFSLTLSPKTFTKNDLPWYNSSTQKLVIQKPYDGTTAVDYTSAALLRDFAANGEALELHITGHISDPDRSLLMQDLPDLKLEFVGDTANCYRVAEDIDVELSDNGGQKGHNILVQVTYGQLYIKEAAGVLQRPTFRRVWAAEDGMRLRDCDLGGGVFIAYLPQVENDVITGYTEVEVKGSITYDEVNHYPGLPSFEEMGVQQGQVYKWVFIPEGNGEDQSVLDNYRFFGAFKPWDPDLAQSSADSTGATGENPPLPAYVLAQGETAPAQPTDSDRVVAEKPSLGGSLGGDQEMAWSIDSTADTLTLTLAPGVEPEPQDSVFVTVWGQDGQFLGVHVLQNFTQGAAVQLQEDWHTVKLIWADGGLSPRCQAAQGVKTP